MQHIPATIVEQLFLKAIREECPWENLPKRLQATLNSKEEWHRRLVSILLLALFPYHLVEYVCRVMRVSPFRYYCDMIFEVMKNEQPYDSIPNFSAADALRLTGIGRNEFIDIMNKCRSKKLSEEEMTTIDKICKEEANAFILIDPDIVKGLYRGGLFYFDVPVYPDDRFKVSRLEGFISSKEQSYEDPIEDENATVAELPSTLQADLSQLQAAASFVCRLGWVVKVIDPASVLQENTSVPPQGVSLTDEEENSHPSSASANMSTDGEATQQGDFWGTENYAPRSSDAPVAFVVDANITSYLMMGSVSPGLKSHAVTLYEAGKLGHANIADLCKDLSTLEGTKFEGELQEFANHAFSLRCVLECLLSGGVATDARAVEIADRMGVSASDHDESALIADTSLTDVSEQSVIMKLKKTLMMPIIYKHHTKILLRMTLNLKPLVMTDLLPYQTMVRSRGRFPMASGPLSVVLMKGQCLRMLPAPLAGCEKALIWSWDGSTIGGLGGKFEGNLVKGSLLLHCLNSLLKYSVVIVQPFSRYDLDDSGKVVTLDIPLPLKNSDGSVAHVGDELGLCAEECSKLNDLSTDLAHKIELWMVTFAY
ncbi:hypothetical protein REPUB_Repub19eG0076000 [Reevesia pubescens]